MNITVVKLEDNKECIVLDEFLYENNKYVILVNCANRQDFIVRKVENNDLVGLDNEEHFQKVFLYYLDNRLKRD